MSLVLWGYLTVLALVLALVFAAFAAVYVKQAGGPSAYCDRRRNRQRQSSCA